MGRYKAGHPLPWARRVDGQRGRSGGVRALMTTVAVWLGAHRACGGQGSRREEAGGLTRSAGEPEKEAHQASEDKPPAPRTRWLPPAWMGPLGVLEGT